MKGNRLENLFTIVLCISMYIHIVSTLNTFSLKIIERIILMYEKGVPCLKCSNGKNRHETGFLKSFV